MLSNKIKALAGTMLIIGLFGCKSAEELSTVKNLDINRYLGTWYEIARLPNNFEKGLKCVTATYSLKENGKIKVLNKGYSSKKEKFSSANGTAWIPNDNYPGRLKVSFFWPFSGNYYVIELADDYSYALIGEPERRYLWILSRTKTLDKNTYDKLLKIAESHGFPVESMIIVEQDCNQTGTP